MDYFGGTYRFSYKRFIVHTSVQKWAQRAHRWPIVDPPALTSCRRRYFPTTLPIPVLEQSPPRRERTFRVSGGRKRIARKVLSCKFDEASLNPFPSLLPRTRHLFIIVIREVRIQNWGRTFQVQIRVYLFINLKKYIYIYKVNRILTATEDVFIITNININAFFW